MDEKIKEDEGKDKIKQIVKTMYILYVAQIRETPDCTKN